MDIAKQKADRAYPLKAVGLFLKFPFSTSDRNGLHAVSVPKTSLGNIIADSFYIGILSTARLPVT